MPVQMRMQLFLLQAEAVANSMTISAAAQEAGVGVETIRYYERRGLIRQPPSKGGYRQYPESTIRQLRFIRESQRLGFSLTEIEELLALAGAEDTTCGDVCSATEHKLAEVRGRIATLQRLEHELEAMLCAKDCAAPKRDCKLLEALSPPKERADCSHGCH
ncbi:MAG: MerR family DNA-binding protein [Acidobacteria bacterium]|nr:MerR family DNA-binding protein [Acidobacteriota bacterium]